MELRIRKSVDEGNTYGVWAIKEVDVEAHVESVGGYVGLGSVMCGLREKYSVEWKVGHRRVRSTSLYSFDHFILIFYIFLFYFILFFIFN